MLSEIQTEFEKVKEKDLLVKNFVNSSIKDLRKELLNFKKELEDEKNAMIVLINIFLKLKLILLNNIFSGHPSKRKSRHNSKQSK